MERIVSGGQTGADRAALDFAIANNIAHGGWCPLRRFAEDGRIPNRYNLKETSEPSYPQRTEWNVRDSDGTVIFSLGPELLAGSKLTCEIAARLRKPCLHISGKRDGLQRAAEKLREFLLQYEIKTLNVAGPRASTEQQVGSFVQAVLTTILKKV